MDQVTRQHQSLLAQVRELLRHERVSEAAELVSRAIQTACDDDDLAAALKAKNRVMQNTDTLASCANYWGDQAKRLSVIDDAFQLAYSYLLQAVCLMEQEAFIEAEEVLRSSALHAPNSNKSLKRLLQDLLVDALILCNLHEAAVLELANREQATVELSAYIERADKTKDGLALCFYFRAMKHLEQGNDAECEADLLASLKYKSLKIINIEPDGADWEPESDEPAQSAEDALTDMVAHHFDHGNTECAHNLVNQILLSSHTSHSLKARSLLTKAERSNNNESALKDLSIAIGLRYADEYILAEALMFRCWIYQKLQNWDKAFSDADKVIKMYPFQDSFLADVHLERGRLRRIKKNMRPQFKRAVDDFTKAIEMSGCEAETALHAHFWRALTNQEAGETKKAFRDYTLVIANASTDDPWISQESRLARADINTRWLKYEEAINDLSAVIVDPRATSEQKFEAFLHRAYRYADLGEVESAERDIDKLLVRCADDETIQRALWLRNEMLKHSENYARKKERRKDE